MTKKKTAASALFLSTMILSPLFAKSVPLLASPQKNAKKIVNIELSEGVIPIIKNNNWQKICSPKTGDCGWIQKSLLVNVAVMKKQIITQNITPNGKSKSVFSLQSDRIVDDKQIDQLFAKMQKQQIQMQKIMQENMQQMLQITQSLYTPLSSKQSISKIDDKL